MNNTMYCSLKSTKTHETLLYLLNKVTNHFRPLFISPKKKNAYLILIVAYFCDLSHSASPRGIIPLEQNKPSQINLITSIGVGLYL